MMADGGVINLFELVSVTQPSEQVVLQIRRLIAKGLLKPGDMLPPERSLSEKLGISRGHVRKGIKTLELYGFVKSIQGKGTVVSDLGMRTMGGMLGNLLKIAAEDIMALADTRILIETHTATLAATRSSAGDREALREIVEQMQEVGEDQQRWLELDLSLHVKIAEASHNPVLHELVKFMTPNIVGYYHTFFRNRIIITVSIHEEIVANILKRNARKAGEVMHRHLMGSRKVFEELMLPQRRKKGAGAVHGRGKV